MTTSQSIEAKQPRWFYITPAKLLFLFLAIELGLWLSDRFDWFAFNQAKGWTVLVAAAVAMVAVVLFPILGLIGYFFGAKPRFGMATMMALIAVAALPFCWLQNEMARARQQRDLRQAIREAGFERPLPFISIMSFVPRLYRPGRNPTEARAIVARTDYQYLQGLVRSVERSLGEDFFCHVVEVRLWGTVGLERLAGFDRLQKLHLENRTLSAAEMKQVQAFGELKQLFLDRCRLPKGGLANIAPLKRLEELRLTRSQVTDSELRDLRGISSLKMLVLDGNPISDDGLEELVHLSELEFLSLDETQMTDKGLEHLLGLKKLSRLSLYRTSLTEAGLAKIAEALPDCRITN